MPNNSCYYTSCNLCLFTHVSFPNVKTIVVNNVVQLVSLTGLKLKPLIMKDYCIGRVIGRPFVRHLHTIINSNKCTSKDTDKPGTISLLHNKLWSNSTRSNFRCSPKGGLNVCLHSPVRQPFPNFQNILNKTLAQKQRPR